MNAALKLVDTDWEFRTPGDWTFYYSASRNEFDRCKVQALRRWNRITYVKWRNKAAAKLSHWRESMDFTSAVLNQRRSSNIQVCLARLIAPFVNVPVLFEFRLEL